MPRPQGRYDTDPAVLKRAVAGAIVQKVEEIVRSTEKYDNEQLRVLVTRFFVDEDLIMDYQQLINEANLKGIKLWDSPVFREQFKADLTTQMNKAIWRLNDSFVILAVLYGDYKPKETKTLDEAPSLEEIFPEMGGND